MNCRLRAALVAGTTGVVLALLLTATAGAEPGFSAQAAQIPSLIGVARTQTGTYPSVSCATSTACTAVGPTLWGNGPEGARATAVTDLSGHWSRAGLPVPAGTTSAALGGVVCGTANDCTAVGGDATVTTTNALVETENSGIWSASNVGAPGGAADFFDGIWCASQGNCVATGEIETGPFQGEGMVAVETAGTWATATALPKPALVDAEGAVPFSIACHDVHDCTVLARGVSGTFGLVAVAWTETSSSWGAAVALPKAGGLAFVGLSLKCPTSTECLAVGALDNAAGTVVRPASDDELSATWSTPTAVRMPKLSPVVTTGEFTSVSCASTTCEAVGAFHPTVRSSETVGGAATWSHGTWSSIALVPNVRLTGGSPADLAGGAAFDAVSCATSSACVGVGTFGYGRGPEGDFAANIATQRAVTVPEAPESVVGDPSVRSATLYWTPPLNDGGSPVTTFTATVEPGGSSCTTGAYHCKVGGLVDGRQYVVRVSATNSAGSGATAEGRFIAGGPPTAPRDFHVVAWAKGVVTLSWHPSVAPPGMRVTSYRVSVYVGKHYERSSSTHATTVRLGGFAAHHRYVLTVSANDLSGGSPIVTLHVVAP